MHGRPRAPVTVSAHDTLSTVVDMMVAGRVHSVFIVDSKFRYGLLLEPLLRTLCGKTLTRPIGVCLCP